MWFKKPKVKARAVFDRTTKIDLEKRGWVVIKNKASKSFHSTSSDDDSIKRPIWKGECSRIKYSLALNWA